MHPCSAEKCSQTVKVAIESERSLDNAHTAIEPLDDRQQVVRLQCLDQQL